MVKKKILGLMMSVQGKSLAHRLDDENSRERTIKYIYHVMNGPGHNL